MAEEKSFDEEAKRHIDTVMNGSIVKEASRNGVFGGFLGVLGGFAIANHFKQNKVVFSIVGGVLGFVLGTSIKK